MAYRLLPKDRWKVATLLSLGCVAIASVVGLALKRQEGPSRCAPGWVSLGPRCCAEGQSLHAGSCVGRAKVCPSGFHAVVDGCAIDDKRVRIGVTRLSIGPNDWQSEQVVPVEESVPEFWVDAAEVTRERWQNCVTSAHCTPLTPGELGQPATMVTPEQAGMYCAVNGGRLPRLNERLALASGAHSRRFPWGQTGLVCRRAAFGVVDGPCAERGNQPDVAGCHPDGRSPEGVFDLSGNVAEIALDASGRAWACGGSFRSRTALELKSWACVFLPAPADDVGFRCVYDKI